MNRTEQTADLVRLAVDRLNFLINVAHNEGLEVNTLHASEPDNPDEKTRSGGTRIVNVADH